MLERVVAAVIIIGLAIAAVGTLFLEYMHAGVVQYYLLSTLAAYIAMVTATIWAMFVYRRDVRKRPERHRATH